MKWGGYNSMRTFQYLNEKWEVSLDGGGHGTGVILPVKSTSYGAEFRCLSNQGKGPHRGWVPTEKLDSLAEEDLHQLLNAAMSSTDTRSPND